MSVTDISIYFYTNMKYIYVRAYHEEIQQRFYFRANLVDTFFDLFVELDKKELGNVQKSWTINQIKSNKIDHICRLCWAVGL